MRNHISGALFITAVSMALVVYASAPLSGIKDAEAKKLHATIGKEVKKIFLDKKGGLLTKNLLKTPLSKSELSSWNSLSNNVMNYAMKCGFFREWAGNEASSARKAMGPQLQSLNSDVLESLARINEIHKKFPKEAKKLTVGEISFLTEKNKQLEKIFNKLLLGYGFANVGKSESQMMTDAALVLVRYAIALQEVCNLTIKLLQEK